MGTFLLVVIIITVALLIVRKIYVSREKRRSELEETWTPRAGVSAKLGSSDLERPGTGPLTSTEDGGWVPNPTSTFPLTVYGLDRATAEGLKRMLDDACVSGTWPEADALLPIIGRSSFHCKQIDDYVAEFKPQYEQYLERLKRDSSDWDTASEKDQADMLAEFEKEATQSLDVRPPCRLGVIFGWHSSLSATTDSMLARYGYNNLRFYIQHSGNLKKVKVIPADHYHRSSFERLVESGLASRVELPRFHGRFRAWDQAA